MQKNAVPNPGFWRETGSQGPPRYPTAGFPLSSMALSIQVGYVIFVILGRFGIAPWSPEMGPNTSVLLTNKQLLLLLLLLLLSGCLVILLRCI